MRAELVDGERPSSSSSGQTPAQMAKPQDDQMEWRQPVNGQGPRSSGIPGQEGHENGQVGISSCIFE